MCRFSVAVMITAPLRPATADGSLAYDFAVDPFRKQCLLNGWDDIGLTLRHTDEIRAFEARHLAEQPWL